jgi:hypothetical protein
VKTRKATILKSALERRRTEVEANLRIANAYWLETVQPYIADKKLGPELFYIAKIAYERLKKAKKEAEKFTIAGPVKREKSDSDNTLEIDFRISKYKEPEMMIADMNSETLAAIAAQLVKGGKMELKPLEAIRSAYSLNFTAKMFLKSLPQTKGDAERLECNLPLVEISIANICESNESSRKPDGDMPLLPAVQKDRNKGKLSKYAIKTAFNKYFAKHKIPLPISINYELIELRHLSELRWERFEEFWQKQKCRKTKLNP